MLPGNAAEKEIDVFFSQAVHKFHLQHTAIEEKLANISHMFHSLPNHSFQGLQHEYSVLRENIHLFNLFFDRKIKPQRSYFIRRIDTLSNKRESQTNQLALLAQQAQHVQQILAQELETLLGQLQQSCFSNLESCHLSAMEEKTKEVSQVLVKSNLALQEYLSKQQTTIAEEDGLSTQQLAGDLKTQERLYEMLSALQAVPFDLSFLFDTMSREELKRQLDSYKTSHRKACLLFNDLIYSLKKLMQRKKKNLSSLLGDLSIPLCHLTNAKHESQAALENCNKILAFSQEPSWTSLCRAVNALALCHDFQQRTAAFFTAFIKELKRLTKQAFIPTQSPFLFQGLFHQLDREITAFTGHMWEKIIPWCEELPEECQREFSLSLDRLIKDTKNKEFLLLLKQEKEEIDSHLYEIQDLSQHLGSLATNPSFIRCAEDLWDCYKDYINKQQSILEELINRK